MMRSKFRCIALGLAAALLVSVTADAQTRPPPKTLPTPSIGILDVQKVMRTSKAATSIRSQVEKLRKRYQADLKREEDALRKENEELGRQRAILSPEAFNERRKAFEQRAGQAQRKVQSLRRDLDQAVNTAMLKVRRAMIEESAKIAERRKINIIIPKSLAVLSAKNLDVTTEILARLDKRLPSVSVEVKPGAGAGKKR